MGGNVAVIVKKENGEQVNMDRWTNVMPYFLTHADLYTGKKEKWFEEFSREWLSMKEDYEKNKKSGNFKFNMTNVYFPFDSFAPSEYGMIVIDLQKNTIYSSQDYCAIGTIYLFNIISLFREDYEDNNEERSNFKKLWEAGYIKKMSSYDSKMKKEIITDISKMSFDELLEFCENAKNNEENEEKKYDYFKIKFIIDSGWKYHAYVDRNKGLLKIRKLLKEDGFVFTEKDDEQWREYFKYYLTEGEDEDFNKLYYEEFENNQLKIK